MGRWTAQTRVASPPEEVLGVLTEPQAIARWAPVDFEVLDFAGERLRPGDRVRVQGALVGRPLEFRVEIRAAEPEWLALTATGPIRLDVEYRTIPRCDGADVHASVAVSGQGLSGRLLAHATETLLAAGALRMAVQRIAQELEPAVA